MDLGIEDKVALVTGGSRGIGKYIALALAKEGVRVFVTSRNLKQLKDFELNNSGKFRHNIVGIQNTLEMVELDKLKEYFDSKDLQVQILVNNAGDTLGVTDPFCSSTEWEKVMRLNFTVPVELCRLFLPNMIEKSWGRVVNITSCAGLENSGPVTFSSAKAAITAYSRSMGRVLATMTQNVVMSAIFPGVVATEGGHWDKILSENPRKAEEYLRERCPLGRFGTEEEVADTVLFYCSAKVSFSQGAIVPVDGGQSKHYMYQNYI